MFGLILLCIIVVVIIGGAVHYKKASSTLSATLSIIEVPLTCLIIAELYGYTLIYVFDRSPFSAGEIVSKAISFSLFGVTFIWASLALLVLSGRRKTKSGKRDARYKDGAVVVSAKKRSIHFYFLVLGIFTFVIFIVWIELHSRFNFSMWVDVFQQAAK